MHDIPTLRYLQTRLETADAADRGLDFSLQRALGLLVILSQDENIQDDGTTVPSMTCVSPPEYTASIDAAVGLIGAILPGAVWHVMTDYGGLNRAKIGPAERPSASVYDCDTQPMFHETDAETGSGSV